MDYNGFVQGVTVYFPVFVPGALFYIGDGHAMQGDGEIVGTGIEISFDVQFTVELRKGKRIGWPCGEMKNISSPVAMPGHWISVCNMPPRKCPNGCKKSTVWMLSACIF